MVSSIKGILDGLKDDGLDDERDDDGCDGMTECTKDGFMEGSMVGDSEDGNDGLKEGFKENVVELGEKDGIIVEDDVVGSMDGVSSVGLVEGCSLGIFMEETEGFMVGI